MTRSDLYYGSDASTLAANSGTIVQAITSPKGNFIFGPWQQTEYYFSVGQGFHSNDLRGALSSVDALATEINFQQGNPTVVTQEKTLLLTKALGYEFGVRSQPLPDLKIEGALFVLDLASEAIFDGDSAETTAGRPSHRQASNSAPPTSLFLGCASTAISPRRARASPMAIPAPATPSPATPAVTFQTPPTLSPAPMRPSRISAPGSAR